MYAFLFMLLNVFGCLYVHAGIEDVQWVSGEWGYAFAKCDACDSEFEVGPVGSLDEAESELEQYFCEDCGFCSDIGNEVCYLLHHCEECGICIEGCDHHSNWATKCIGKRNKNIYRAWIISIVTFVIAILSYIIL